MEILDQMLSDVRHLYEQATGTPYSREKLRGRPLAVPKEADAEAFLYQQIAHLRNLLAARTSPFWSTTPLWMPVLDAYEAGAALVLRIELPGLTREDVTLSIGESLVVLKGERTFRMSDRDATVLARERFYGPFERWIPLPYRVKPEVEAKFENGVLEIRLQKAEAVFDPTRKVDIK
ncbi:MAG: Hsp20/alpha crystallin family protein [Planctomycetes bacterium]|nr:Hsp20/alpha crystallin family protein [Planctomycetota bacterium]